ncbi:MAG: PHP domain-containing protein [Clostridia bacterium]|nr:PHP domain-containing protein [Clostridia bacterium]
MEEVATNEKRSNKIDIHTHSTHSDGTFEVSEILEQAEKLKLSILSITDHNSVGAYDDIQDKQIREKFKGIILPGCEVTTTYNGEIIEVLGYGFDYEKFREELAKNTLSDRDRRLRRYKVSCITVDTLEKRGMKFRENFGEEIYKNPKQFYDTRNEAVMDAILREIKNFPENEKFFEGKENMEKVTTKEFVRQMIYNPKSKLFIDQTNLYPTLEKVIQIIHDSGGIAFLAHLHVYSKTIEENLTSIVDKYELDGLECYYTTFSKEQIENLKKFCKEKGLYMSGGSDFHGTRKQKHELGIGSGDLYVPKEIVEEWIDKLKVVYKTNEIVESTMEEKFEIMPIELNTDAHNHTRGSDGRQTTFRTMLRAYNKGINTIAITDHDSVRGFRNLEKDIYSVMGTIREDKSYDTSKILEMLENMKVLKGTELITSYNGVIVEVLGYNFDIEKMEQEIAKLKTTVKEKPYEALYKGFNKIIDEKGLKFDKSVLDEAYEKIKTEGKGGVVGPFYNELIKHEENKELLKYTDENGEEKEADTMKLFINKHLYNKKSSLFVDMSNTRPNFKDTIDAIHRAGGQAFLAHAGRYKDKMPVEEYIDDMIAEGLDGLEVYYPDHSYEFREFLLGKVREHGIKASGGSDDHHAEKEGIQYQTGRVAIPDIPETRWIADTCENGKDFLNESIEIGEAIKELRELKGLRSKKVNENNELDKQINEKQEISR